jgi:DNA repair protein RadD
VKLSLRYYQQAAINATMDWFTKNSGNPLIVLPTGTGKALLCAELARIVCAYPNSRVLVVTHVQELVEQNYREMIALWPDCPAGIYASSLKRKDTGKRVTFCSIQTVWRNWDKVPRPDIIIIDEAHLIPRDAETMYGKFLNKMTFVNPAVRVVGLTATPYRMDSGRLDEGEGRLFSAISYEYEIGQAIADGFLAPLVSKDPKMHLKVDGVGTRGGEFIAGELQRAVDTDVLNRSAVEEAVACAHDRRGWLFFCSGVQHSNHVAQLLRDRGIAAAALSSETPAEERAKLIANFKSQRIRALCSMNILTTGFNAPHVDMIAMLRPTKSASLYIQMAGRGTRPSPGKANCLVLDFAGNVSRFGPIDAVNVKKPGEGGGDAPVKICPQCSSILHASVRACSDCGFEFPKLGPKIVATASTDPLLSVDVKDADWVDVDSMGLSQHVGSQPGKPNTVKVTYYGKTLGTDFKEWICFDHPDGSFPRKRATTWWVARGGAVPAPASVDEAIYRRSEVRSPSAVLVRKEGKYWTVLALRPSFEGALPDLSQGGSPLGLLPIAREKARA